MDWDSAHNSPSVHIYFIIWLDINLWLAIIYKSKMYRIDTNRTDTNRTDTNRTDTNRIDTKQLFWPCGLLLLFLLIPVRDLGIGYRLVPS